MPNLTVAFWNIQNFGRDTPYTRGRDSAWATEFMAQVVHQLGADILFVMEVMPSGEPDLNSLQDDLNNTLMTPDWSFDFIPAAYASTAVRPVTLADDTAWACGGSRHEGYAVFWKTGNASFQMVKARFPVSEGVTSDGNNNNAGIPNNVLSLIDAGRLVGQLPGGNFGIDTGYNPGTFPLVPFDVNGAATTWSALDFMSAGKGEPTQPRFYNSRRAAYCSIVLLNAGYNANNRQIPIVAYHAPSYAARAQWGTYLSGLGRQMSVTRDLDVNLDPIANTWVRSNNVICGGDFNVNAVNNGGWYDTYTHGYTNVVWTAGANCQFMAPANSTVQLNQLGGAGRFNGPPVMSANVADYYRLPIDNLFYRGLVNPQTQIVDLISEVMLNPNVYTNEINTIDALLADAVADAVAIAATDGAPIKYNAPITGLPVKTYPSIQNFALFRTDVQNGFFSNARRAAEFIDLFISDHMPIAVSFDVL